MRRDFVETGLSRREDGFALLMEKRGKEKEFGVFDLKAAASLAEAAFAEQDDLVAATEGIDDDGPFLESDFHRRIVARLVLLGEGGEMSARFCDDVGPGKSAA